MRTIHQAASLREQSMKRIALSAMGLVILVPALGVLYLFWKDLQGKWLPLLFLLFISILGFFLMWTIVSGVSCVFRPNRPLVPRQTVHFL